MINSILPYYGCKREQAKGLDELFGDHVAWWDLTCGSLALCLANEIVLVNYI